MSLSLKLVSLISGHFLVLEKGGQGKVQLKAKFKTMFGNRLIKNIALFNSVSSFGSLLNNELWRFKSFWNYLLRYKLKPIKADINI